MLRKLIKSIAGKDQVDGAGVQLTRVIGRDDVYDFDPFLMLDAFDHDDPAKYTKGFPWHPHRGIETVTYLLEGEIEHGDSLGNSGVINDGECQWMTAGSGIIHQEMPRERPKMLGVQLWVNLPAGQKMTVPKYRDFKRSDMPKIGHTDGSVRLIAGRFKGQKGPMEEITAQPTFLEVTVKAGGAFSFDTDPGNTVFIYILRGSVILPADNERAVGKKRALLFGEGKTLRLKAGDEELLFLLFAGKPLDEPIAWGGPIVMNTREELAQAFKEIEAETFIKEHHPDGSISAARVNRGFYR